MAVRLNALKADVDVRKNGEWVELEGIEFDGVAVKTRGFTNAYTDYRQGQLARAAVRWRGDVSKIPSAQVQEITVEAMIRHCLVDVRGLENDDGSPVTFDQFCNALREEGHEALYVAVIGATADAGRRKAEAAEDAAGNS